jgi:hypothetical protein
MAQPGDQSDGVHEVMGSIPISSTNSSNNVSETALRPKPLRVLFVSLCALFFNGARAMASCAEDMPFPPMMSGESTFDVTF